jgi:predicted pyridoxine 5'-phosphate oxidase superfamily flavin-nucleotide-binding protein
MTEVFHSGELAVQTSVGVRDLADRVGRNIRLTMSETEQRFLQDQQMAVIGAVDSSNHVWASLLMGEPGFIQVIDERTVRIDTESVINNTLSKNLLATDNVGLLVINLASRKRMRLNGKTELRPDGSTFIHARQVFSNCTHYVQTRKVVAHVSEPLMVQGIRCTESLTEGQQHWIEQADTFFIATFHPEGGADASHRGGNPGFIRIIDEHKLVFPDYSGNNMFQTLGNIFANPHSGLLFIDFVSASTLQLTGEAKVILDEDYIATFPGAKRVVEFHIQQAIEMANACPLRWELVEYSSYNPT